MLELNKIYCADYRDIKLPIGIMITDPPYNQGYGYDKYNDNLSDEQYIELLSGIKKPCVIIHYPEQTINILPKILGECDECVSWVYSSRTKKQSRLISRWGCKPDFQKVKQPYKPATLKDKRNQHKLKDGRGLTDWWEIPYVNNMNKEKTEHPCQIPEEIIRRIISTTCKKGDTIIDPFLGSGTTCKVAKDLGFNFIGFDISQKYVDIANKRLETTTVSLF